MKTLIVFVLAVIVGVWLQTAWRTKVIQPAIQPVIQPVKTVDKPVEPVIQPVVEPVTQPVTQPAKSHDGWVVKSITHHADNTVPQPETRKWQSADKHDEPPLGTIRQPDLPRMRRIGR